ncbi:MAG TPA: slipin family protein [Rhizomicrobium sp.]|nr:slipin family protein [Rhizomicrobium sp.]
MEIYYVVIAVSLAFVAALVASGQLATVTIYEYQRAVLYYDGAVAKVLSAGRHRYWKRRSWYQVVDIRGAALAIPGQEILTKDDVNLKISLIGTYAIVDPVRALHGTQNYASDLYSAAQIALRDLVARMTLDELLEKRSELDARLLAAVAERAAAFGIAVSLLAIKDVMLPANLKRVYSAVVEAKKEAQRQLEQARGEQAVLRSLANSAGLLESHPMLLQARLVQALAAGNNTIVFGADGTLALKDKKP